MPRRLLLMLVPFILGAGAAVADEKTGAMADIKANCKTEWATDYSMQEYCISQQVEAINAVSKIYKSPLSFDEKGMMDKCLSEWSKPRGADWTMVEYCYNQQHERHLNELDLGTSS
ncbi:hypothetical protein FJ546_10285 [Mesorhizobium sp. B2-4-19]|uniref:hypothetical protein n=1 Tax=Mesorhizobium sp. B2-4-19 TaxID=2589930 RepID=UPI001127EDB9|nr:hypothetical protein [Mesorhizobium sp. B2-4-19]TPK65564.1 hypothetical protein FJ546_10285 [Mesorhizobium sp. B2-4-19]